MRVHRLVWGLIVAELADDYYITIFRLRKVIEAHATLCPHV